MPVVVKADMPLGSSRFLNLFSSQSFVDRCHDCGKEFTVDPWFGPPVYPFRCSRCKPIEHKRRETHCFRCSTPLDRTRLKESEYLICDRCAPAYGSRAKVKKGWFS